MTYPSENNEDMLGRNGWECTTRQNAVGLSTDRLIMRFGIDRYTEFVTMVFAYEITAILGYRIHRSGRCHDGGDGDPACI